MGDCRGNRAKLCTCCDLKISLKKKRTKSLNILIEGQKPKIFISDFTDEHGAKFLNHFPKMCLEF